MYVLMCIEYLIEFVFDTSFDQLALLVKSGSYQSASV